MATTPTRHQFLAQALKYFSRQKYMPRELIVVDDPGESAAELCRTYSSVRYLQTRTRMTLGSKLNFGITESRGRIIQKLDDDDYYAPYFLETTVSALSSTNRLNCVVGCSSCLVLIASTGELKWRRNDMFAGGTFCFFCDLWNKNPFRNLNLAEDSLFLKDNDAERIGLYDPEIYIYVRHGSGHLWTYFLETKDLEAGPVRAGDDVTQYLRRLPNYARGLRECIPIEDWFFYERQIVGDRRQ